MIKRPLRRSLVNTPHTKRSEQLRSPLKIFLRNWWPVATNEREWARTFQELISSGSLRAAEFETYCPGLLGWSFEVNHAAIPERIGRRRVRSQPRQWPATSLHPSDRIARIFSPGAE